MLTKEEQSTKEKQKILVTGGTGMIGKAIKDVILCSEAEWYFLSSKDCDLRDREQTLQLFKNNNFTYVIHLAANVGGLYKNMRDKVQMFRDNVRINENVLEACHETNIQRGIFCLTSCMYPQNPPMKVNNNKLQTQFPMDADSKTIHYGPPHFSNEGYAYAKRMLEMQCRNYNEQYGREYICVIPVNLYGPNDNYNLEDAHVVPALIHKFYLATHINKDKIYTMYGSGKPLRQFLFCNDFARFLLEVLYDYKDTKTLICCNEEEYTIQELVYKIASIYNFKGEIKKDTSKEDGCYQKTMDYKQCKEIFPDFVFTKLDDGLSLTIEWFMSNYEFKSIRI